MDQIERKDKKNISIILELNEKESKQQCLNEFSITFSSKIVKQSLMPDCVTRYTLADKENFGVCRNIIGLSTILINLNTFFFVA